MRHFLGTAEMQATLHRIDTSVSPAIYLIVHFHKAITWLLISSFFHVLKMIEVIEVLRVINLAFITLANLKIGCLKWKSSESTNGFLSVPLIAISLVAKNSGLYLRSFTGFETLQQKH